MQKQILKIQNVTTPTISKTNIIHEFCVDEDFSKLTINFSYSPKVMADKNKSIELITQAMKIYAPSPHENAYGKAEDYLPIVNLLTVSLDSPTEYIGCAHRHANSQQHVISKDNSSLGFKKTEICKGKWRVVVNLHCVITESCEYNLEVLGEIGGENI
ncbi:MAG: hypothetical protein RR327_02340 [Clostridia bacterium]